MLWDRPLVLISGAKREVRGEREGGGGKEVESSALGDFKHLLYQYNMLTYQYTKGRRELPK